MLSRGQFFFLNEREHWFPWNIDGQTETMTLTTLVTGVTCRYPGVLAKTVTTLDVLSQGRSMLGIGAAYYEREHVALGIPYPPVRERFEMLEETLQICAQMWSDNDGSRFELALPFAPAVVAPRTRHHRRLAA